MSFILNVVVKRLERATAEEFAEFAADLGRELTLEQLWVVQRALQAELRRRALTTSIRAAIFTTTAQR